MACMASPIRLCRRSGGNGSGDARPSRVNGAGPTADRLMAGLSHWDHRSSHRLIKQLLRGLNIAPHIGVADGIRHHQIHGFPGDQGQLPLQIEIGLDESCRRDGLELHQQILVAAAGPERGSWNQGDLRGVHPASVARPGGGGHGRIVARATAKCPVPRGRVSAQHRSWLRLSETEFFRAAGFSFPLKKHPG